MKKQMLFALILTAAALFFNSCEEEVVEAPAMENLDEHTMAATNMPKDSLEDNALVTIVAAQINQIDSSALDVSDEVASRSGRQLIQQFDITMNQGQWYMRGLYKSQLANGYRYIARVISYTGDPDLYIHGRKPGSYGAYRTVRSSRSPGPYLEEVSATFNDLATDEDRMYFSVYAQTNTRFILQIFREPICYTAGCLAGSYYIKSALTTYLDVLWANRASGTNVWAYNYTGTAAQGWTLIDAGNNYYYIKSDLGTYLDVQWGNSASGTNVWAYAFTGTPAQKWYLYDTGEGSYYIGSALGTYLDVYNGNSASGTEVWAYRFNGTTAQKWQIIPR